MGRIGGRNEVVEVVVLGHGATMSSTSLSRRDPVADHICRYGRHRFGWHERCGSRSSELRVGDTIHVLGHTSDFTQTIVSIQIEHEIVESAKAGASVGVKVNARARVHDQVLVVTSD